MREGGEGLAYSGLLLRMDLQQPCKYPENPPIFMSMTVSMNEYSVASTIPNNTQAPMEQQATREVVETAKFDSDRVLVQKTLVNTMSPKSGDMSSISESRSHEIRNFLGRPVVLRQFLWNTIDVVMTPLATVTLPDDLTSHDMYKEKLRGFLGFRAEAVIRVQINAQRFQQGRLMLCWLPQGQLLGLRSDVAHSNLVFCTQLPRIDFDLATDTDVSLRIPYVSPTLMYNLANGIGPFGTFKIFVYSPFKTLTGAPNIEVTVFGHFENVELEFPAFVSQSGRIPDIIPSPRGPLVELPSISLSRRIQMRDNIMALIEMLDDRQLLFVRNYFRDYYIHDSGPWKSQCADVRRTLSRGPRKRSRESRIPTPPPEQEPFELSLERRRSMYYQIEQYVDSWSDSMLESAHTWLAGFVPRCSVLNVNRIDLLEEAKRSSFHSQAGKMSKIGNGRGPTRSEPSTAEAHAYGVGPISSALNRVSLASRILGEIPLLSSITGPVSWATAIMSRAASAFGFAKPRSAGSVMKQHVNSVAYMNNADGQNTSHSMGLLADNHVASLPGFAGTDNDEMALSYMLSIPTWFRTQAWTTSDLYSSLLFSVILRPAEFEVALGTTSGGKPVWGPTPMAYLRRYFNYWRGGICFKFKFVKTEFHTGRLLFAFNPSGTYNNSMASTEFMYKEIIDIRESNEFTITVPYAQVLPYLSTATSGSNGFLYCYVLNPLVAPDTVSTSIDILMEVHAAEDFEFAFPGPPTATPVLYFNKPAPVGFRQAAPDVGSALELDDNDLLEREARQIGLHSQALGENVAENEHSLQTASQPESIGTGSPAASGGLASSLACIGEKILSLRQLMNRSIPLHYFAGAATRSTDFNSFEIQLPLLYTDNIINSNCAVDYYAAFASLFAYKRGSVRYTAIPVRIGGSGTGYSASLRANLTPATSSAYFSSPRQSDIRDPWNVCAEAYPTSVGLSVEIPQYTQTHSTLNRISTSNVIDVPDAYSPNSVIMFRMALAGANTIPTTFYRSIAEDFQLGFFIGTIPQLGGPQDGVVGQSLEW